MAYEDSVRVAMAAPAAKVWGLLSDVTRIGELSPETFDGEWLDGATGPTAGAWFRGHVRRNERGPVYWTRCRVTDAEPGRSFGFDVHVGRARITHWRYDIVPTADGCEVTETFRMLPNAGNATYWALAGRWRSRTNRRGMTQTLHRAKAIIEA